MKVKACAFCWLAAILTVSGTARAQDPAAQIRPGLLTNAAPAMVTITKAEPRLTMGSHTVVTGLAVDMVQPKQTLALFHPTGPAVGVGKSAITLPPPATAPPALSGPAFHGPNFAVLRFNFP